MAGWVRVDRDTLKKLLRHVNSDAKLVYFAIRACPDGTALPSVVEADHHTLTSYTELPEKKVIAALRALQAARLIEVDQRHHLIVDLAFPITKGGTPEVVDAWWRCWRELPECSVRERLVGILQAASMLEKPDVAAKWASTFGTLSTQQALFPDGSSGGSTPPVYPHQDQSRKPPPEQQSDDGYPSRTRAGDSDQRPATSERKADVPAGARARDGYGIGALQNDWLQIRKGKPAGDGVQLEALLARVKPAAMGRGVSEAELVAALLPAAEAVFDDMRERGVHHGAFTAGTLANEPREKPGLYFAQALDWMDGKRIGKREGKDGQATAHRGGMGGGTKLTTGEKRF